ncbi:MAG: manganese efflux pump MntP family protein [Treponemataceae bacterium]|nr:manganese efflux pump [Treponema sp.]MDE7382617.1 manganese efflux pump MntP family protein [Treponemataceae bacterium]
MNFLFFVNSIALGIGLAMDAFSVSVANALHEPKMPPPKMCLIAGVFAFFQFFMPMAGWICVHTIVVYFERIQFLIPWIALILLGWIGGKMIIETMRKKTDNDSEKMGFLSFGTLLIQGIATSIDALSVGFTTAEYSVLLALISSFIIAIVTFILCIAGIVIGKKATSHLSNKAGLLGGVLLLLIGLEIFIRGVVVR